MSVLQRNQRNVQQVNRFENLVDDLPVFYGERFIWRRLK